MPTGIYLFAGVNLLLGISAAITCAQAVPEFTPEAGTNTGNDFGYRFAAPAFVSGLVAGLLLIAAGVRLLIPGWKRAMTAFVLASGAAAAQIAMAACALAVAFLGHSGGLAEAFFLVLVLPVAMVLLAPTVFQLWYLRRPHIRQALDSGGA